MTLRLAFLLTSIIKYLLPMRILPKETLFQKKSFSKILKINKHVVPNKSM